MATTSVSTHQWVRYSVTEVDVIVDLDGRCFADTRPDTAVGEQLGCHNCGEPLTDSSVWTPCDGE